ncbi:MAG: precorrin-2 C(20)-methyltransferase [Acidiphilium sp.]|nr:precorrin-2 C(20)-methyltransferase [Acidiphilium sp.]MDD4935582.1 precorrin-2 C(20)-methyltransferase [Acidiphilium sp.]
MSHPGTLYTVGMGPGDPDLLTLKAARILRSSPVIAFFAKRGCTGHARCIADAHINKAVAELRFEYPFTTEIPHDDPQYRAAMDCFYDKSAESVATALDAGQDVALLCEGDPFFYGSAMYLFDRLGPSYRHKTIPGITGMSACWTSAGLPIAHGDDVLSILPGTLSADDLTERLRRTDAAVIMKVGRNLAKIRTSLAAAGLGERAVYVERGAMAGERIVALRDLTEPTAPYFSMILVPGRQGVR